jgi:hypothetical protein
MMEVAEGDGGESWRSFKMAIYYSNDGNYRIFPVTSVGCSFVKF